MDSHPGLKSLRIAVPYIRPYKGRIFVVKIGGGLCRPGPTLTNLADQAAVLHQLGIGVVLVHGGGEQATALGRRLGIEPEFVAGRRITNADTLEVVKMAFAGAVNADLLAAFRRAKVPAIGLSGIDAALVSVHRRPVRAITDPSTGATREVDFGFVGDVDRVDAKPLLHLLTGDYVPVVCSLAADAAGQIYNVNADTLAASIAVEVRAAKYFSVTTVNGVLDDVGDPHTLHSYLDIDEAEALVRSGRLSGGMLPKLAACLDALRGGVERAHVVNGARTDALLHEIFTNEGCGTMIVARREENRPADAAGTAAETVNPCEIRPEITYPFCRTMGFNP